MTDQPEPTTRRGLLAYKSQLKLFSNKSNFVNARGVFLVCRKYKMAIPEEVLQVITATFKVEHVKYRTKELCRSYYSSR